MTRGRREVQELKLKNFRMEQSEFRRDRGRQFHNRRARFENDILVTPEREDEQNV